MTTYYRQPEIKESMKLLVDEYLNECYKCKELSTDFSDLLKHNFLAKFAYFNEELNAIEIGVESMQEKDSYPEITLYSYPLDDKNEWLEESFKNGINDLTYYGSLINRRKSANKNAEVVVL